MFVIWLITSIISIAVCFYALYFLIKEFKSLELSLKDYHKDHIDFLVDLQKDFKSYFELVHKLEAEVTLLKVCATPIGERKISPKRSFNSKPRSEEYKRKIAEGVKRAREERKAREQMKAVVLEQPSPVKEVSQVLASLSNN